MGFYGNKALWQWSDAIKMYLATKIMLRRGATSETIEWTKIGVPILSPSTHPWETRLDYVAWFRLPNGPSAGMKISFAITQPLLSVTSHIAKFWNDEDKAY